MRDSLVEALQTSREVEHIGGFVYLRHAADPLVWLNASIPLTDCTEEDVKALLKRYVETERVPFFEFSPDVSPEVPALLEAAGIQCIKRMPVMAIQKAQWIKRPYADRARAPMNQDHEPGMDAASEAFGHSFGCASEVERRVTAIAEGRVLSAVGFSGEQIVASGIAVGTMRVREVAGIGTRPAFQRQGFGAAVIDCLLDQFFSAEGEMAWLTPGDDGAESLYRNRGFETVGNQVVYAAPEPSV